MTVFSMADSMISVVSDLSSQMTPETRFERLLEALLKAFPCDAAALLRLNGSVLIPLATRGLSDDTAGRAFQVEEHPRFAHILMSREPVRFAADSELPDPYDGLIDHVEERLHVHDCMGVALYIDEQPWGVLTLDALEPCVFDGIEPLELRAFVRLTEASIRVSELIQSLQKRCNLEHEVAQVLIADLGRTDIIGDSPAIKAMLRELDVVAASDLSVLITGETGVGKELVARHLHAASARADAPLVYVNCAALPENLVESELFGHTRGAFSGAASSRTGKFELAQGGTLFLDEIGEMPLAMQPKLLRALQSGEVQRVGSDQFHQVDVRIIAATNRDLAQEVAQGRFRADLYHRLSVYPIQVPPLRERGRDILRLAGHFLELNRRRLGLHALRLDNGAREALLCYDWPGNVRELEHLLSRAVLRLKADAGGIGRVLSLTADLLDLPQERAIEMESPGTDDNLAYATGARTLREATDAFQCNLVIDCLARCGCNRAAAARELGLDPGNFNRLLKRLQIDVSEVKSGV
ncbi:nitric oxide reductase transcriptional regulator NorR [Marinobacterium ramblicola]|uniref:nitric oxide reductase transcriptional regulator NorR n=1 Tax=Marinobacterium ramblicola TaxID=2849041 RepID=UPI001FE4D9D6|nr:nitric oxide reductase transcriptional regulator NorR [Marinobacterium ramblicola]